jgi:hypothetical protein
MQGRIGARSTFVAARPRSSHAPPVPAVDSQTTHARASSLLLTRGVVVRPLGSGALATPVHGERVELHAEPLSLAPVHFALVLRAHGSLRLEAVTSPVTFLQATP